MYSLELEWKEINLNMEAVETHFRANAGIYYVGNSAGENLILHFSQEPDQSVKDAVQEYYDELDENSPESISYVSQSDIGSAIQVLRDGIDPSKSWDQLSVVERKLILNQSLSKKDLGL